MARMRSHASAKKIAPMSAIITTENHMDGQPPPLQKRVADDLDVIPAPNDIRDPAQPNRNVFHRKDHPGQQEYEQKSAQRHGLDGRRLVGNAGADEGSRTGHAERIEHARHDQRRGIAGDVQTEDGEQQGQHDSSHSQGDHHVMPNIFPSRNSWAEMLET